MLVGNMQKMLKIWLEALSINIYGRMIQVENNIAYLVQQINEIWEESPGKKAFQKLVFLMIEKGIPLRYDYGLHFYGPYSATLDAEANFLNADGVLCFSYEGNAHKIRINKNDEMTTIEPEDNLIAYIGTITDVIEHFKGKSPSELELLSTAIYAYNHLESKARESVVNGVLKIKGNKYKQDDINDSLNEFAYFGITI